MSNNTKMVLMPFDEHDRLIDIEEKHKENSIYVYINEHPTNLTKSYTIEAGSNVPISLKLRVLNLLRYQKNLLSEISRERYEIRMAQKVNKENKSVLPVRPNFFKYIVDYFVSKNWFK